MSGEGNRLESELVDLFGRSVVDHSKRVSYADLLTNINDIAEAAHQLGKLTGQPDKQRVIVAGMNGDAMLGLCKWIREPATGANARAHASNSERLN